MKINLSVIISIDLLYFLLKATSQFLFHVESIIIESSIVYLPLIFILYAVLFVGNSEKMNKINLYPRAILHDDNLFDYAKYIYYIHMLVGAFILSATSVFYRKIIGGTSTSKWETLILAGFCIFSMAFVYRKILLM